MTRYLIPTKGTLLLLVLSMLCFSLAACAGMTGETVAAAATGATAGVVAIVEALKPLMEPELAARMELLAHNIDGTTQATAQAVGTLVDAVTTVKTNAAAALATVHGTLQAQAEKIAEAPSMLEVVGVSSGTTAAGGAGLNALRNASRAKVLAKPG